MLSPHTLARSYFDAANAVVTPSSRVGLPTRNDCLDALARVGYDGPTSWTARDLRPRAALLIALSTVYRRPITIGRNRSTGRTRNDCLALLAELGYDGPTSFTAARCNWLVDAVYAETVAD